MISKCDLCGKKTTQLNGVASMLKDVKNLKGMCNKCMERMNEALGKARVVAHKVISDAMVEEAEQIRSEHKDA